MRPILRRCFFLAYYFHTIREKMGTTQGILRDCFEPLRKRLFSLEHSSTTELILDDDPQEVVQYIATGIFKVPPSEAMDYLETILGDIKRVQGKSLEIIESHWLEIRSYGSVGYPGSKDLDDDLQEKLKRQLDTYEKYLNELLERIQADLERTEGFSPNAGFRLQINLTSEQIGHLFNLFYESKIINNQVEGEALTKRQLAYFIGQNFLNKRGQTMVPESIEKNYFQKSVEMTQDTRTLLKKLQVHLDSI